MVEVLVVEPRREGSEVECEALLPSKVEGKNLCIESWLEELDLAWRMSLCL